MQFPRPHEVGLSDEDHEAFYVGVRATLDALTSDDVYYEVCDAKQTKWTAVEDAAAAVEKASGVGPRR